jgi:hypothetical protein
MGSLTLSATAQRILEGVPLPATRAELVEHARRQGAPDSVLAALGQVPDRAYDYIDDVGEQLAPVQPERSASEQKRVPHPESGRVPGGSAYTDSRARPGAIREAPKILEYEVALVRNAGGETPDKGAPAPRPAV